MDNEELLKRLEEKIACKIDHISHKQNFEIQKPERLGITTNQFLLIMATMFVIGIIAAIFF